MTRSRKHSSSGPLLLSSPICREMESNPDYVSSENIIPTLAGTGVKDEGDMIYDEIQNEQITPDLFMKDQDKQVKEEKDDENDFFYRDLATRNCLVGKYYQIKIADFGMSLSLYEFHYYVIKGHAVLPVRWMAKECFYGKFSTKTDVWAFGVTMWEIYTLAKDIPYEDMDDSEVAADASKRDGNRVILEKPKDCPQEVYDIMLMCWKEDPIERATFDKIHSLLLPLN